MTEKPYGLVHAKSLLAPCGASGQWDIDERGVSPKAQPKPSEGQTQTVANQLAGYDLLLAWRPAEVFKDDTPAPDLINTPSLPFPFDAKDLAAFMLYGVGSFVAEFYGKWEDGPDKSAIDQINPLDTFARQAVVDAFAACREAQKTVSPYPLELYDKAERARKAWNDADSETNKETKAALDLKMEATAAEAKAAQGKWLEDMVRLLLKPAQEQTAATPAPVAADSASDKSGSRKLWTPEKLAELAAYRAGHTMAETVTKFSISEQRIRKLLPSATPKASFFPSVIHRVR